jgi:hypothetical protein
MGKPPLDNADGPHDAIQAELQKGLTNFFGGGAGRGQGGFSSLMKHLSNGGSQLPNNGPGLEQPPQFTSPPNPGGSSIPQGGTPGEQKLEQEAMQGIQEATEAVAQMLGSMGGNSSSAKPVSTPSPSSGSSASPATPASTPSATPAGAQSPTPANAGQPQGNVTGTGVSFAPALKGQQADVNNVLSQLPAGLRDTFTSAVDQGKNQDARNDIQNWLSAGQITQDQFGTLNSALPNANSTPDAGVTPLLNPSSTATPASTPAATPNGTPAPAVPAQTSNGQPGGVTGTGISFAPALKGQQADVNNVLSQLPAGLRDTFTSAVDQGKNQDARNNIQNWLSAGQITQDQFGTLNSALPNVDSTKQA